MRAMNEELTPTAAEAAAAAPAAAPAPDPEPGIIPHRFHTTSFTLKLAAIICMTCNHAIWTIGAIIPQPLYTILYCLGGATYPIMAFMLVEGYRHTSNLPRYFGRLLLWAAIAEVPFYFFLAEPQAGFIFNVLFTLAMGLALLWLHDNTHVAVFAVGLIAVLFLSKFCDWSYVGPVIVMSYFLLKAGPGRKGRRGTLITLCIPALYCVSIALLNLNTYLGWGIAASRAFAYVLPDMLYGLVGACIATVLLCAYDGTLGRALAKGSSANRFNWNTLVKWGFYAYYPLHIAVLGLISLALGL